LNSERRNAPNRRQPPSKKFEGIQNFGPATVDQRHGGGLDVLPPSLIKGVEEPRIRVSVRAGHRVEMDARLIGHVPKPDTAAATSRLRPADRETQCLQDLPNCLVIIGVYVYRDDRVALWGAML
jgi:hypothetical protein